MPWGNPLQSVVPPTPPANSKELAVQIKPALDMLRLAINRLLAVKFWYSQQSAGGSNAGTAAPEEWNPNLALTCKMIRGAYYVFDLAANCDFSDPAQTIKFDIYDSTGAAVVVAGVDGRESMNRLRAVYSPAADGIRTFIVRATSGFASAQVAGADDLFSITEVPFPGNGS